MIVLRLLYITMKYSNSVQIGLDQMWENEKEENDNLALIDGLVGKVRWQVGVRSGGIRIFGGYGTGESRGRTATEQQR